MNCWRPRSWKQQILATLFGFHQAHDFLRMKTDSLNSKITILQTVKHGTQQSMIMTWCTHVTYIGREKGVNTSLNLPVFNFSTFLAFHGIQLVSIPTIALATEKI